MNQSNDQENKSKNTDSAEDMQRANARGENQNEQGQSSWATGSTTGGGSNFGQGSSHLSGESYRQGDETNSGSNYNDESGRLGSSSVGTSNEGASANVGASASGYDKTEQKPVTPRNDDGGTRPQEQRGKTERAETPSEGDRRNTELERNSGLGDHDARTDGRQSGSWSRATTDE